MDLSPLIFVALLVAWGVFLVPKAIKHQQEVARNRPVDRFSRSMRVVARREVVDRRNARLVATTARDAASRTPKPEAVEPAQVPVATAEIASPAPEQPQRSAAARRAAARQAVQRRRRVLGAIVVINALVALLAATSVIGWLWMTAPVVLLIAWLAACRLMVKGERSATVRTAKPAASTSAAAKPAAPVIDHEAETGTIAAIPDESAIVVTSSLIEAPAASTGEIAIITDSTVPGLWDPVPTTLPTYVTKSAAAQRAVTKFDLDSTGVWSSGRSEIDSALAREAEESERVEKSAREHQPERKVSGA